MLFIVYGATLERGYQTRKIFRKKGFEVIKTYNYVDDTANVDKEKYKDPGNDPVYKKWYDSKVYITKDELDKLDFNFGFDGIHVGFDQEEIMDAVRGVNNAILTVGGKRMDFLRNLKTAFGDYVTLIDIFEDDSAVRDSYKIIEDQEERQFRITSFWEMQDKYLQNKDIFDEVVIYTGEGTVYDLEKLEKQYDNIIEKRKIVQKKLNDTRYVDLPYTGSEGYLFVSYAHEDREDVYYIMEMLQRNSVRLWYDDGIPIGTNWRKIIEEKIKDATGVMLFYSKKSEKSEYVSDEMESAKKAGKDIYLVCIDESEPKDEHLSSFQWIKSQEADFENTIVSSLPDELKDLV